ncbi:PucR family transcriptional regulator [Bacillus sp. B1-b2]|uniref:PucR family transcriptional regulator n=1 Tax=Bacillus sp. B1-b2 TaxID=2653201 RepID=UPI0018699632|nr:PucR family transcriptional regulator ligand-binding domain-containing protein [Bacillus sp. B1-b2]
MKHSGISVNDLLKLPVLKEAKVISGKEGLNRTIQFVDIMEVPDIDGWLREGELLLTTAYSIRHDLSLLTKLVQNLEKANAAALAIKPERYLHEMPEETIKFSNNYHFPIIQLPKDVPYIDITNAVMEQIINKQATMLKRSEGIYKKLTTLVLENSGIQTVADNVSSMMEAPIIVLDTDGNEVVCSPRNTEIELCTNVRSWEITVDKEKVGKFLIAKDYLDEMDKVCIEQARLVFALEFMRRKTAVDTKNNLRGDFMEELLSGIFLPQEEVVSKGKQLGLNPDDFWGIIVIESKEIIEEDSPLFLVANKILEKIQSLNNSKIVLKKQGNRLIGLSSVPSQQLVVKEWILEAFRPIKDRFPETFIGVGGRALLWEIHLSYLEARNAIKIGSNLNKKLGIYFYEDVEMFKILLDNTDSMSIDAIIDRKIGKLIQYDKENGSDLVKTLFYYLSSNGSLKETASLLYIHRNSVNYRMERIREIADISLEDFQDKLLYYLCIFFHRFKGI